MNGLDTKNGLAARPDAGASDFMASFQHVDVESAAIDYLEALVIYGKPREAVLAASRLKVNGRPSERAIQAVAAMLAKTGRVKEAQEFANDIQTPSVRASFLFALAATIADSPRHGSFGIVVSGGLAKPDPAAAKPIAQTVLSLVEGPLGKSGFDDRLRSALPCLLVRVGLLQEAQRVRAERSSLSTDCIAAGLAEMGRPAEAVSEIRKARTGNPPTDADYEEVVGRYTFEAEVLQKSGDRARASAAYADALKVCARAELSQFNPFRSGAIISSAIITGTELSREQLGALATADVRLKAEGVVAASMVRFGFAEQAIELAAKRNSMLLFAPMLRNMLPGGQAAALRPTVVASAAAALRGIRELEPRVIALIGFASAEHDTGINDSARQLLDQALTETRGTTQISATTMVLLAEALCRIGSLDSFRTVLGQLEARFKQGALSRTGEEAVCSKCSLIAHACLDCGLIDEGMKWSARTPVVTQITWLRDAALRFGQEDAAKKAGAIQTIESAVGPGTEPQAEDLFHAAQALARLGRHDKALAIAERGGWISRLRGYAAVLREDAFGRDANLRVSVDGKSKRSLE